MLDKKKRVYSLHYMYDFKEDEVPSTQMYSSDKIICKDYFDAKKKKNLLDSSVEILYYCECRYEFLVYEKQ